VVRSKANEQYTGKNRRAGSWCRENRSLLYGTEERRRGLMTLVTEEGKEGDPRRLHSVYSFRKEPKNSVNPLNISNEAQKKGSKSLRGRVEIFSAPKRRNIKLVRGVNSPLPIYKKKNKREAKTVRLWKKRREKKKKWPVRFHCTDVIAPSRSSEKKETCSVKETLWFVMTKGKSIVPEGHARGDRSDIIEA